MQKEWDLISALRAAGPRSGLSLRFREVVLEVESLVNVLNYRFELANYHTNKYQQQNTGNVLSLYS